MVKCNIYSVASLSLVTLLYIKMYYMIFYFIYESEQSPYFVLKPAFQIPNEILQYLSKIAPFTEALFINLVIIYFAGEQNDQEMVLDNDDMDDS